MAETPYLGMDYTALLDANREMEDQLYTRSQSQLDELARRAREQMMNITSSANETWRTGGEGPEGPQINTSSASYTDFLKTRDEYEKLQARRGQGSPYSYHLLKEKGFDPANMPDPFKDIERESETVMRQAREAKELRDKQKAQDTQYWTDKETELKQTRTEGHKKLWDALQQEILDWWNKMDAEVREANLFGDWGPDAGMVRRWRDRAAKLGMTLPTWTITPTKYKGELPQAERTPWPAYDAEKGGGFTQQQKSDYEYGAHGLNAKDFFGGEAAENNASTYAPNPEKKWGDSDYEGY